jgi:hypothetical protein
MYTGMEGLIDLEKCAYTAAQKIATLGEDDDDECHRELLNIYNNGVDLASRLIRIEMGNGIYQCELQLRELTSQFSLCISNDGKLNIVYNLHNKQWDVLKKEYDLKFDTYEENLAFLKTLV